MSQVAELLFDLSPLFQHERLDDDVQCIETEGRQLSGPFKYLILGISGVAAWI